MEQYSAALLSRVSNPAVQHSSLVPTKQCSPQSTFIPGTIPLFWINSIKLCSFSEDCLAVSSNIIIPETYFSMSLVVNKSSLYFCRFNSVLSILLGRNYFLFTLPFYQSWCGIRRLPGFLFLANKVFALFPLILFCNLYEQSF